MIANNASHHLNITDEQREFGISVSGFKENLVRTVDMKIYDSDNSLMQKGDVILSQLSGGSHITICNEGLFNNTFINTNISKACLSTVDIEVIHNYGATNSNNENRIYGNINYENEVKNGCYMKTLCGPYKNTGIPLLNNTNTDVKSSITIGRVYLWS